MATLIRSATRGTSSIFDTVSASAAAATSLINVGSKAIAALDIKTESMLDTVRRDAAIQKIQGDDTAIAQAAREATELMEEIHLSMNPEDPFDKAAKFNENITKITKAFNESKQ